MSKTFPGTRALDDVDFDLRAGEIHALLGENGSGKSTLIKVLAGYHQPDPGSVIELDGEVIEVPDTTAARGLGFRFVHQDMGLVDSLSVAENLAIGRGFRTGFAGRILWKEERRIAGERLRELGYDIDVRRAVGELSASERTGVAIARAIEHADEARVLVMDEPTASLPREEVEILLQAVSAVRRMGLGVIYVSHRLEEVFAIADRATVLRDGRRVGTRAISQVSEDGLIDLMVGGEALAVSSGEEAVLGPCVLETRGLRGATIDGVDLQVQAGEVLGVAGLMGSGREELLPLLFGVLPRGGDVILKGKEVTAFDVPGAMRAGFGLVPADRRSLGSFTALRVDENCTITDLRRHSAVGGWLSRSSERREVVEWIQRLDIRPSRPDANFATLSGGNQQRVVLAKWLRMKPTVLLLDEPTQGVDVHAKAMIHALARQAAIEGAAVILASSDDIEICDTCDRVIALRNGTIAAELRRADLNPDALSRLRLGQSAGEFVVSAISPNVESSHRTGGTL